MCVCIYIYIYIYMDGWMRDPVRPEVMGEKTQEVRSETLDQGIRDSSPGYGSKTRVQSSQRAVWSQERRHRAVKKITG